MDGVGTTYWDLADLGEGLCVGRRCNEWAQHGSPTTACVDRILLQC